MLPKYNFALYSLSDFFNNSPKLKTFVVTDRAVKLAHKYVALPYVKGASEDTQKILGKYRV